MVRTSGGCQTSVIRLILPLAWLHQLTPNDRPTGR